MRRPSPRMFPNAVTVQVATYGQDTLGGRSPTWTTTGTALGCNVQATTADRAPDHLKAQAEISHVVYFRADPSVRADDRLVFGTRTFAVLAPAVDATERTRQWAVWCKEHPV